MKDLYAIALCLFATLAFGQDTTKTGVKKQGFWVAASYGYNTRSFIPDFYQNKSGGIPGEYTPKAYLAGHMPTVEVGYNFNRRTGLFAAFSMLLANKHNYDGYFSGYDKASGWYASLGGQLSIFNSAKICPYAKASINTGVSNIRHLYIVNVTQPSQSANYEYRGGYTMGGTVALGTDFKISKRIFVLAEVNFTAMVYKPKERKEVGTDLVKEYNDDLSGGYYPNPGTNYLMQEYFRQNFISFRVGLRYNLFGE